LNDAGAAWEEADRLDTPRIFHQLLPAAGRGLLAIAGANRAGHLADIECINVDNKHATAAAASLSRE
jgi:hypothetical protein